MPDQRTLVSYVRYKLRDREPAALIAACRLAAEALRQSPDCLECDLSQCAGAPVIFILRIVWLLHPGDRPDRRETPFGAFFAAIRPFLSDTIEISHYHPTGVGWSRRSGSETDR